MADYAPLVVGSAVAAPATHGVKLAFYLVQSGEITTVRHLPVRPGAELNGRLHLDLIGVTIIAERAFVADGAVSAVGGCMEPMVLHEDRGVIEGDELLMTFRATHPSSLKRFGMPRREAREGFQLGAGRE